LQQRADFIVIGAGIAGASAAYFLSASGTVILLERESQPGYHSTGRSAAIFTETYGNETIRALTRTSRAFLADPPHGFADQPLLLARGLLYIASENQRTQLEHSYRTAHKLVDSVQRLSVAEALDLIPVLKEHALAAAVYEPDAMDIDVAALHQGYLKGLAVNGGTVLTGAEVTGLDRTGSGWQVTTRIGSYLAEVVINAAGAWCDVIAEMASAGKMGLKPLRRTVILFDPPDDMDSGGWPFCVDIDDGFYFKPYAGKILASPADESPTPPCDAQPEEIDVATAAALIEGSTSLEVTRISHKWAGLRTFSSDSTPIVGFDRELPGFFWLAGQGGYGIKTSPALGRIAAELIVNREIPRNFRSAGIQEQRLAPERFQPA
jgi:D-arginine dehydrogenase|tara:strand:- start:4788 stop:5921 length:1134 start_codon:yes stop_codon:yes gene_type:complete